MSGHESLRECLPLYALGALAAGEAAELENHLAQGCEACAAELGAFDRVTTEIGCSVPLVPPSEHLLQEILRRAAAGDPARRAAGVWTREQPGDGPRTAAGPAVGVSVVHHREGVWDETGFPGITFKRLFVDAENGVATMLVRMQPGASYPRHRHTRPEECYVIEGDLHAGDLVMRSGDFQRAEAGSVHVRQFTVGGCLCYITAAVADEILA